MTKSDIIARQVLALAHQFLPGMESILPQPFSRRAECPSSEIPLHQIPTMRLRLRFRIFIRQCRKVLARLSFRTGVIVLLSCVLFYFLFFAQMLLPISASVKGVLWFILFGMAKATQYTGLAIVGVEGVRRIKKFLKRE